MVPSVVEQLAIPGTHARTSRDATSAQVEQRVARTLDTHPHFCGRMSMIRVECRQDTLILSGRLPSFYLKQLLQEAVRRVNGVGKIDNRVDVTSCNGVSSMPTH